MKDYDLLTLLPALAEWATRKRAYLSAVAEYSDDDEFTAACEQAMLDAELALLTLAEGQ